MLFGHAREMMDKIRNELVDQLPSEDVVQQGEAARVLRLPERRFP